MTATFSPDSDESTAIREQFAAFVRDKDFPCVGAKSALSRGTLETCIGWSLDSSWNDVEMHRSLLDWSARYKRDPGLFRSLAWIFKEPRDLSESEFEQAMWNRLQSLADKDVWLGQPYDGRVSADPDDPHFSLSFGGEGYFVVGMHPNASRPARRFDYPVMVFNLHDQFEKLRAEGRYESIRESILDRDEALAGSRNPMLHRHGESSEAAQYSGRKVDENWKPPFKDKRGEE